MASRNALLLGRRAVTPYRLLSTQSTGPYPSSNGPSPRITGSSRGYFTSFALVTAGLGVGVALSLYLPRPRLVSLVFPVPTPHPHPRDSAEALIERAQLEATLQAIPLVSHLRAERIPAPKISSSPSDSASINGQTTAVDNSSQATTPPSPETVLKWTESRPYAATPAGPHSLSGFTLRGPGAFNVPPLVFTNPDKTQGIFFMHLGSGLCGHEGIVHGGVLAVILDESLARTALLNLPTNIGVTASLALKYKKPTFANQFVVIRTELVRKDGRKAYVKGIVQDLQGETLVTAEGLFIEPKMAKFLSNSSVREALK